METEAQQALALEKAAKYICNQKCGLCPMVLEHFCPQECTEETVPWQCWQAFFKKQAAESG